MSRRNINGAAREANEVEQAMRTIAIAFLIFSFDKCLNKKFRCIFRSFRSGRRFFVNEKLTAHNFSTSIVVANTLATPNGLLFAVSRSFFMIL